MPGAPVALPVWDPAREGMRSLPPGGAASAEFASALAPKLPRKGIRLPRTKQSWLGVLPGKDWHKGKNTLVLHGKEKATLKCPSEIHVIKNPGAVLLLVA